MKPNDIELEALRLDPKARASLARRLIASLDELSQDEVEALWAAEAERRDAEDGSADRAAAEVFADARAQLR